MKTLVNPLSFASLVSGLSLGLLALACPLMTFGQTGYQVQGPYNPAAVQAPRQASLIPTAYQQRGVPTAGAGLQYTPQAPSYQRTQYAPQPTYRTPTTQKRATAPAYAPTPPSQLPSAYAQQGQYAQPQPYPGYVQPKPAPTYHAPVKKAATVSTSSEISALKQKDKEQDRRLSALEGRGSSPRPTTTGYTKHTVRRGESLWGIAERYGVSESSLKTTNRRTSDVLIEGETLLIPGTGGNYVPPTPARTGGTHIVQRGESLSKIANSYHISTRSLQEANGIRNPNIVEVGRVLNIPGSGRAVVSSKPKTTIRYVSKPKQTVVYSEVPPAAEGLCRVVNASGPRGVTSYRVEAGDGIESVARNFSTTPSEIQRMNKLSSQRLPAVGEEIIVPLPGSVAL